MKMDMNKLLADMQKMQKQVQERIQEIEQELSAESVIGSAGGGLVEIELNGHRELKRVSVKPEALDDASENIENLEDLIYAALNSALTQARELHERKMSEATGGMDLGGLMGDLPHGIG